MDLKSTLIFCFVFLTFGVSALQCNVQGCQSCEVSNICNICKENYILQDILGSGSLACVRANCTENCATCNKANQCHICNIGYTLNSYGQCESDSELLNSVKSMRVLQSSGSGNQSSDSYSNCTIFGCEICSGTGGCQSCKPAYTKNPDGICISCNIENCNSCSVLDACDSCNPNDPSLTVSTNGASCLICEKNHTGMTECLSCSGPNECGQCSNGFQLVVPEGSTAICIKCSIDNCKQCGVNSGDISTPICQICQSGYSPSPSGDSCILCMSPCNTCTSPNICATCVTPFHLQKPNANGTCNRRLIAGCQEVQTSNSSRCSKCEAGYNLVSDSNSTKCVWFCPENCAACTNATMCSECASGFVASASGQCSKCQTNGCDVCSSDGVDCQVCLRGFYLIDKECKKCPGFCAHCTSNLTCVELLGSGSRVLMFINGKSVLAVCEGGCATCSNMNPQICLVCSDGYYFKQGKCSKCTGGCKTCDGTDPSKCFSCFPNNFLTSNKCTVCSSTCMTCKSANAPSECTSCFDGSYLKGTQCIEGCSKNCLTCSNETTCTECIPGYTLFNDNSQFICAPCVSSCTTCAEGKPSECLGCREGFYLTGLTCSPCPSNCATCTATGCSACADGFFVTSEQTCASDCILPCATCSASDPTQCTSCIAGYNYDDVAKKCVEVTKCATGCVACPLGYSLKNAECLACSKANCQSCNADNLNECFGCKPTFYLTDAGACETCPSQCNTCLSSTGCLTCADGYTKKKKGLVKFGGAQCVKCNSPCATCSFNPNNCQSCIAGYKFFGWKCTQTFRFSFKLTFLVNMFTFNANYLSLIRAFMRTVGGTDLNAMTFDKITEGSVIVEGHVPPTAAEGSPESAQQLQALSTLVKQSYISDMPLGESQLTVNDGTVGSLPSSSNSLGIILGICIPVGVLIILSIIAFCLYKKKQTKVDEKDDYQDSTKEMYQDTEDKFQM